MSGKIAGPLLAVVLSLPMVWGQDVPRDVDVITLGSTTLYLGLARDAVLSELSKHYTVVKNGELESWTIKSKDTPPENLGQISFKGGKLVCADKLWTGSEDSDFAFANVLHGALNQFQKEGRNACLISTDYKREPSFEERSITFHCGPRELIIETDKFFLTGGGGQPESGESTLIEEVLSSQGTQLCSTF
ncbi:MAG TPA: hypothetical protein VHU89_12555 [Acidobacteriaceae bacterium]|jgi:hypothetical protein|nr:hypothetical protein [Acidobacteriaceae bacterium]